jgi:UrcA family protein
MTGARSLMAQALAGALTIIAITSGGASAQETAVADDAVHIGDLDLATPAGSRVLVRRIQMTARRLCDELGGGYLIGTWQRASDFGRCRSEAVSRAVASLGAPAIAAADERVSARQVASSGDGQAPPSFKR